jgi:hypothetical protein
VPIVGVVCGYDGAFKDFQSCIHCHETFDKRNCDAPVELLKIMRDNSKGRPIGWSASMLTSCPRALALLEVYDYYEPLTSGWNKARGTIGHLLMEFGDSDPPSEVTRERRVRRTITVLGEKVSFTGKFDKVYQEHGVLMDFKTKHEVPKGPDSDHLAQFNIYVWLLANGIFVDDNTPCQIEIKKGGMHYITFSPKTPFKKIGYDVWPLEQSEAFIVERLTPLVLWHQNRKLPVCNPHKRGRWKCDCVKITEQLEARNIEVEEMHGTRSSE